ncbi:MAG: HNH endonuclease [Candidatus Binatia bacterium]
MPQVLFQGLVEAKKHEAAASGSLSCEVCGFDFEATHGTLGRGFCEVHHRTSLARSGPVQTALRDLAIVCSNCHRMLHRPEGKGSIDTVRRAMARHEAYLACSRRRRAPS